MKQKVRIAHTADLHLGAPLTGLGKEGPRRSANLLNTFFRMLDECQKRQIQILLIAGDFLEAGAIRSAQLREIQHHLAQHAQMHVFISPGNHDYWTQDGPYAEGWSENVHIFRGPMTSQYLPDLGVRVYGAAFTGTYQKDSLLHAVDWEKEREAQPEALNLLLIHADWGQAQSPYHPLDAKDLPADFFTYVAMGHVHKRSELYQVGKTRLAYPGCPDGMGFDETGVKGMLAGEVEPFSADIEFVPLSSRLFRRLLVDVSEAETTQDAWRLVDQALQSDGNAELFPLSRSLVRLYLTGEMPQPDPIDPTLLLQQLRSESDYVVMRDVRKPAMLLEEAEKEESLRGYFISELLRRRAEAPEEEKSAYDLALRYGLDVFAGKEVALADTED